ncbi:UNVERIFIED_ORG: hypothetical protein FHR35_006933 [Microbispora rosea subsp. rosea]
MDAETLSATADIVEKSRRAVTFLMRALEEVEARRGNSIPDPLERKIAKRADDVIRKIPDLIESLSTYVSVTDPHSLRETRLDIRVDVRLDKDRNSA